MMHIDAPPTVPREIQTPSRFFPAVPPPFRFTPPPTVPTSPPQFTGAGYRAAIALDDPVGFERWADLLDEDDWDAVAEGLNGLLPTRLCLVPARVNAQYKAAAERLSPETAAWCRKAVLLARDPIGWHDVRVERRFQVDLIVRALRRMAMFVDHFEPLLDRHGSLRTELEEERVFEAATLTRMQNEVTQQMDGARAWDALTEDALEEFEPMRALRSALSRVSVDALYAVHEAIDEKMPWLTENYGQGNARVRRWWRRWASSPATTYARWLNSFDDLAELHGHVSRLAGAARAWGPNQPECVEAVHVLTEPKNIVRRAGSEPDCTIDVDAVQKGLQGLELQYRAALGAARSSNERLAA